jgi:hypothetical protein
LRVLPSDPHSIEAWRGSSAAGRGFQAPRRAARVAPRVRENGLGILKVVQNEKEFVRLISRICDVVSDV